MRTITGSTRSKIMPRDLFYAAGILFLHYGFYVLYVVLILALRLAIKQDTFFPNELWTKGYFYYPVAAPLISAFLHLGYAEVGSPVIRFFMWLHMMLNIIYIAVVVLI